MPGFRLSREHGVMFLLGTLLVAIAAAALLAVRDFRASTDRARASELSVRAVKTDMYAASAAGWQAVAQRSVQQDGLNTFHSSVAAASSSLADAGRKDPAIARDARELQALVSAYRRAVELEFHFLQLSDPRSVIVDVVQVNPLFRRIGSKLSATDRRAEARRSSAEGAAVFATRMITAASLLSVLVVLGLLMRTRRRILVAQVEQQALKGEATRREFEACHDELTGLLNRRGFFQHLRAALLERHDEPAAVLLLDLDGFKEINDTLGHAHGDRLLALVGPRLQEALRDIDVVARLGGDEFAVFLTDLGNGTTLALEIAQRLRTALSTPFPVGGLALQVQASVGVSIWPDHGPTADELLRRADIAMYLAKTSGGIVLYADNDDPASKDRLELAGDLEHAIRDNQLVLHYQPIANLGDDSIAGVEALVRWNHPEKGLLAPDSFIPIAERNGLIRLLTLDVVDRVFSQLTDWRAEGIELKVAINLSIANLLDADLADDIEYLLKKHRTDPHQIRFEITESYLLADPIRISDTIARLSALGIALALDDFGTGYSSFTHLRQLPIDEIKIDRTFVRNLDTNDEDEAIVRATINLAQQLDLCVVAEGVETAEIWQQLRRYGCNQAQGFYLAKPMPAAALTGWLLGRTADVQVA